MPRADLNCHGDVEATRDRGARGEHCGRLLERPQTRSSEQQPSHMARAGRRQRQTYSYEVGTSSWTGFSTRTVLQFESGVATYRRYDVLTPQQDGGTGVLTLQWEERGTEVGGHSLARRRLAPVDALYDQCGSEVLTQDPDRNDVTIWFDDAGILLACFYIPPAARTTATSASGLRTFRWARPTIRPSDRAWLQRRARR